MDYATCMPKNWLMDMTGEELVNQLTCEDRHAAAWVDHLMSCEEDYMYLIGDEGYQLKPEEARGILPLDTKSELIMTGFISDWLHFFALRSYLAITGKPHPDIAIITNDLILEFLNRGYITNEDIDEIKNEKRKQSNQSN